MVSRGILRILNHFWFLLKLLLEAWYFQLDWKFHFAIFNAKINELSIYHLLIPMIQDFKWWLITNIFIQTRKKIFLLWFISIVLQFSKRILNFKKEFFLMWTFWEKYLINMWATNLWERVLGHGMTAMTRQAITTTIVNGYTTAIKRRLRAETTISNWENAYTEESTILLKNISRDKYQNLRIHEDPKWD